MNLWTMLIARSSKQLENRTFRKVDVLPKRSVFYLFRILDDEQSLEIQ
jgi:hypothetical protein